MIYSKRFRIGFVVTMIFTFCIGTYSQTSSKEETRFPWASSQKDFIRDWLIIGGFPNQDENGFDTDYLQETAVSRNPTGQRDHSYPSRWFKFYWEKL